MRFNITGSWNKNYPYRDGMLFFAQRVEEMLMEYTSHFYKFPAFNVYTLIHEYIQTAQLVNDGIIDKGNLPAILEEFCNSVHRDVVINSHFAGDKIKLKYFVDNLLSKNVFDDDKEKLMHYLLREFSSYYEWCRDEALKTVTQFPEKKDEIDRIAKSLVSTLIFRGYHPRYIYWECKTIFSWPDCKSDSHLHVFLSRFDFTEREYTVYFAVSKKAQQFREILERRLRFIFQQDNYAEQFFSANPEIDREEYTCVHISTKALDRNRASEAAYLRFSQFIRYYKFLGNRDYDFCPDKSLVVENGHVHKPPLKPQRYRYSWNYDDKYLGHNAEKLLEFNSFEDFSKVEKMIMNHNYALESPETGNSFLNLWSILEIIGVYGRHKAKITEILDAVIPVLKRNYVRNLFDNLHSCIKANLPKNDYISLFSSVTENGGKPLKTACIVALQKYQSVRQNTIQLLANYPLITNRISRLNSEVFSRKSDFLNGLEDYAQRVRWHIQRLYRTRNAIVHSGDAPQNIKLLSEHLHDYVDELLMEVISRLACKESLGTISNFITDAKIFVHRVQSKCKNSTDAFTYEDLRFLIEFR